MAGRATIAGAVAASLPVAIGLWVALRHGLPPIAAQPMLFALQCAGAVVLLALVPGIEAVAHERLFHRSIDPLAGADSPRLIVNQRYIQNTLEQLAVLLPGLFLLAQYEPDLRLVAATAILWTLGRWAWWVGYHIHPLWRGLGVYSMFLGMAVLLWGVGRFGIELAGWAGVAALLGPFALIELWLFRVLRR